MVNLILAIVFSIGVYLVFRLYGRLNISVLPAVVFNYFFCFFIGAVLLIANNQFPNVVLILKQPWFLPALANGFIFFISFWFLAITTQKTGMAVSAVSSRLSLIMPVALSVFVLKSAVFTQVNYYYVGLLLAILSIVFSAIKKQRQGSTSSVASVNFIYPLGVFVLTGLGDSFVVFINSAYSVEGFSLIFPVFLLLFSGFFGLLVLVSVKLPAKFSLKNIKGGAMLAIPGFFSLVFIIKALEEFNFDGSLVYPVVNIGTIVGSSLLGVVLFKENFSWYKAAGLLFGVASLGFISLAK